IYQRQGEVASGLLPNWMTGYAFLFPSAQDISRARQLKAEVGQVPALTIGYDPGDSLEKLIAERAALNLRDAGINLNAVADNGGSPDLRIAHWMVPSVDTGSALNELVQRFNVMPLVNSNSIDAFYFNEHTALQTFS